MNTGIFSVAMDAFGVLLPWIGVFLLGKAIASVLNGKARPVQGLVLCLGASVALLLSPPWSAQGFRLPIAWLMMPFQAWATLACGLFALASLVRATLEANPTISWRFWKAVGIWSVGAIGLGVWTEVLADPILIFKGSIPLSWATGLGLLGLGIASIFAMSVVQRQAHSMRLPKVLAVHLSLIAGSLLFGLPFIWLLLTSFKEEREMSGSAGIVWIPHVQVTVPFLDPKSPLYSATYEGTSVEVRVIRKEGGGAKVEIQRPGALHGIAFDAKTASLKEIPKQIPVVQGMYDGREVTGRVIEEMSDGHRRIEITSPPEMAGRLYTAEPAQVHPVQKVGLRWQNYTEALEALPAETSHGLVYLRNTLIIVIMNLIGTLLASSLSAYAFARMRFPGRSGLFTLILSTMMLPAAVTLMPSFLIYRYLGWVDTLFPLWVPAFFGSAFNIFLLRQFFLTIPMEFEDAAKIDGCSYLRTFWSIMLPQIKPALAAIAIWTFMGSWGDFMGPLIYISSPENMTVSYAMQLFSGDKVAQPGLLMAFATMAMIPVLTLFFFAQRYFVQGMALTGLSSS